MKVLVLLPKLQCDQPSWSGPSQAAPSSFEQRLIFEEHFADPSIFLCKTSLLAQLGLVGPSKHLGTVEICPNQLLKKTYALLKTCSCRPVHYFGMLFWDDLTIFWDENLLFFTFLGGKLRKNLFWINRKFVYVS